MATVGLVFVALIAWSRWPRSDAGRIEAPTSPDVLDALPPGAAYDSALALATSGRSLESLPLYRRAQRGVQEDFWQLHMNYGSALYNLTLQPMERRGVEVPRTRSTLERVALIRESIAESGTARALARTPGDRATVYRLTGKLAHVYGFPWEAFVAHREAQFANPGDAGLRARADQFQANLEHPTATNTVRDASDEARVER